MIISGLVTIFVIITSGLYIAFDLTNSTPNNCDILELGIQPPEGSRQAKKVKVELFYETLCPDVKNFIQGQLYPVWEDLSDIMEIHWKPYGFAKVSAINFAPEVLREECRIDTLYYDRKNNPNS